MNILIRKLPCAGGSKKKDGAGKKTGIVVQLTADMLDAKKTFTIRTREDVCAVTQKLRAEKERLEDIHRRLDIAIKSGLVSGSIH